MEAAAQPGLQQTNTRFRQRLVGSRLALAIGYAVVGLLNLFGHVYGHVFTGCIWLFMALSWSILNLAVSWELRPEEIAYYGPFGIRKVLRYDQISMVGHGTPPHSIELTIFQNTLFQSLTTTPGMTVSPSDEAAFLAMLRPLVPQAEFRI